MSWQTPHVLLVPACYPSTYNPARGIFCRDQAEVLAQAGANVGVLAIIHVAREFITHRRISMGLQRFTQAGVNTWRFQYPSIPHLEFLHNCQRTLWGRRLFQAYVAECGLPDILHVHSYLAGDLAIWVKQHYGIPYVLTEHFSHFQDGTLLNWQDRLARRVFQGSSANCAVSQVTCDVLTQRYGVPFSMVPNVVKTDVFTPLPETPAGKPAGARFVTIGSLDDNKNHRLLLAAFAEAFPQRDGEPVPTLTIVGDGPLRGGLQREVRNLKLSERVLFTGQLAREQVRDVLCRADAYAQCSKVETFAVVLVEAMSCGLPLLSTRCGGPESIITEDYLGLLCDRTVPAVAQGLRTLRDTPFDRRRIREHAVRHYSMPVIAARLLSIYRSVIADAVPGG